MQLAQSRGEVGLEAIVGLLACAHLYVDDDIDRRGGYVSILTKNFPDDSFDPIASDRVPELLGGGNPQPRPRGRSRKTEEKEEGTMHAMPPLIDFEKELAGTEARGTRKRAVRAAVVRARDACAPSRGVGQGQDAPPWYSCARGTRASSCAGDCSVETCASLVRFLELQGESSQSTEGSAECQARPARAFACDASLPVETRSRAVVASRRVGRRDTKSQSTVRASWSSCPRACRWVTVQKAFDAIIFRIPALSIPRKPRS